MPILISGIGRSGTTTIYKILGQGFLAKYKGSQCKYEPYLWNIPEIYETAEPKGQPFSNEQVGLFNTNVHYNTPLFLSGRHVLHDHWLQKVFNVPSASKTIAPNDTLVKVIRGSGRLESILSKYANIKIIILTRNIIDTVNSGLGLFSFFGDEFHPSDKTRFIREINQKFDANIDINTIMNEIQWAMLWWRYNTEASIQIYEKFPDRVKLVPYESYNDNKTQIMQDIFAFSDIESSYINTDLFEQSAGPITSTSHLTNSHLDIMQPEIEWYFNRLRKSTHFNIDVLEFTQQLRQKYSQRPYRESFLLAFPTNWSSIQWRNKYWDELHGHKPQKLPTPTQHSISVTAAIAEFGSNINALIDARLKAPTSSDKSTIGVLITSYNDETTIADTILSVLAQTRSVDLVYVADDCSRDKTVSIISNLAVKYPSIKLVQRPMNIGVSANRDLAIRAMDVDYISTLDGDDLFFPEKIELEFAALNGVKSMVAFSDIVIMGATTNHIKDTSPYSNASPEKMLAMLTSRSVPVPRDMLFSKDLFIKSEGFDVGMSIYEDWAFKMRLMSSSGCWVHSRGKGTIYNRRQPGLSGKSSINHAYGELTALARNANLLKDYPELFLAGLTTASKHLEGDLSIAFNTFLGSMPKHSDSCSTVNKLLSFWENVTFQDDTDYKIKHIWSLISSPVTS